MPDPTSLMQFCFDYSVNGGYYSGFEQPEEMQELNNQATVELDVEKRKELYKAQKASTTIVKGPKVGRNDPCPCGSGKKYKKCCGR